MSKITTTKIPDKQLKSKFLQYGDEIILSYSAEGGFLLVEGDLRKTAWIPPVSEADAAGQNTINMAAGCDIKKYVFRVEPPSIYKAKKAFYKLIHGTGINTHLFQHALLDLNFKPADETPVKLEELRTAAIDEQYSNDMEFLKHTSKPVLYGSIIQLKSGYSDEYMAVNPRVAYGHESWALNFQKVARKDCYFRVMPKLRIRSKGEPVRIGDAVVLQSVKTEGFLSFVKIQMQDLSLLKRTNSSRLEKDLGLSIEDVGDHSLTEQFWARRDSLDILNKDWLEVCVGSNAHGWTVHHFDTPVKPKLSVHSTRGHVFKTPILNHPTDTIDKNVLKGGAYIRLYHKERQAYMNCNRDLTGQDLLFHEQVHLSEFVFDPLNPQDTTSCTTFWQIESKFPFQGNATQFNQPIRLRHAALNAYLHLESGSGYTMMADSLRPTLLESPKTTLMGDHYLTLRSNPTTCATSLFMFVPVTMGNNNVTVGTHVRIQHVATGCWLTSMSMQLNRMKHREGVGSCHTARSSLLQRDVPGNELSEETHQGPGPLLLNMHSDTETKDNYIMTASMQQHSDDYFAISEVDSDLVDNFRYAHALTQPVERFLLCPRFKREEIPEFTLGEKRVQKETLRGNEKEESEKFPISKSEFQHFKDALTAFIYFCTISNELNPMKREGTGNLAHQTLLREIGAIDMLIQLLKYPFDVHHRKKIRKILLEVRNHYSKSAITSISHEQKVTYDDIKLNKEPVISELLTWIYKVLSVFMLGSNHENQLTVAKEFDILSRHFSLDLGASEAIMQLITGNALIAQSVSESQIMFFLSSLEHDKNPNVIHFLTALCYMDGKPIPKHQQFICKQLVDSSGNRIRRTFMNETRVRKGTVELLENPILDSWTPLRDMFDKEEEHSANLKLNAAQKYRNQIKLFFISTLRLYEGLCKGHNRFNIKNIVSDWNLISLQECMAGMFDDKLPNSVRSLYCDLIRVLFIDYHVIPIPRNEFVITFDDIEKQPQLDTILVDTRVIFEKEGEEPGKTSGLTVSTFEKMDEWLLEFFQNHKIQYVEHAKENKLILSTLELLRTLMRYGFYRDAKKLEKIIFATLDILDGRNDARNQGHAKDLQGSEKGKDGWWTLARYDKNEEHSSMNAIKTEICRIIEIYFRFQRELRVYWYSHYWLRAQKNGLLTRKNQLQKLHNLGFDHISTLIGRIMQETHFVEFRLKLKPILIDLIKYEDETLKRSAIQLLHGLRSPTEELIAFLGNVYILEDEQVIKTYQEIKSKLGSLIERLEMDIFSDCYSDEQLQVAGFTNQETLQTLHMLSGVCLTFKTLPGSDNDDDAPETRVATGNKTLQTIVRASGIHKHILEMIRNRVYACQSLAALHVATATKTVKSHSGFGELDKQQSFSAAQLTNKDPPSSATDGYQSELLVSAFKFFKGFTLDNEDHQEFIFTQLDLLLEATHPLRSGLNEEQRRACIQVISDFLSQNANLCAQINVNQVKRILELSGGRRVEYIQLLINIVKSQDVVIKRNQNIVMKLVAEKKELYADFDRFISLVLNDEEESNSSAPHSEEENEEDDESGPPQIVIQVSGGSKSQTDLMTCPKENREHVMETEATYFKELLNLLTICCDDKNKMMQTICRNIISLEQLFILLEAEDPNYALKGASLRFLARVFITHPTQSGGKHLQSQPILWEIIEEALGLLRERNDSFPEIIPELDDYLFRGAFVFMEAFYSKCFNISFCQHSDSFAKDLSNDFVTELEMTKGQVQSLLEIMNISGFRGNKEEDDASKETMKKQEIPTEKTDTKEANRVRANKTVSDAFQSIIASMRKDAEVYKIVDTEFRDLVCGFRIFTDQPEEQRKVLHEPIKCLIEHLDKNGAEYDLSLQKNAIRPVKNQALKSLEFKTHAILMTSLSATDQKTENQYYDTRTLQILTWIVQEPIDMLSNCNRYRHPEQWAILEKRKTECQNEMDRLGCTLMAKKLLVSHLDGIVSAALQLLISLLDGGNRQVQQTLLSHWVDTKDEQFFHSMFGRVETAIGLLLETEAKAEGEDALGFPSSATETPSHEMSTVQMRPSHTEMRGSRSMKVSQELVVATSSHPGLQWTPSYQGVQKELEKQDVVDISFDENGGLNSATHTVKSNRYNYEMQRKLLRFFQLIAEGHNISLQNYMNHQSENVKSYDLVKSVVDYVHAIVPHISEENIPVIIQAFDTLIDFAQGCTRNQVHIYHAKIIQPINSILENLYSHVPSDLIISLKGKAVLCLLSLLEDDSEVDNRLIFEDMPLALNLSQLITNLNDIFEQIQDSRKETSTISKAGLQETLHILYGASLELLEIGKSHFNNQVMTKFAKKGYKSLIPSHLLQADDTTDANTKQMEEKEDEDMTPIDCGFIFAMLTLTLMPFFSPAQQRQCEESEAFKWFKKNTGHIEIVRESPNGQKQLYMVLYPIPEICYHLRKDTSDKFLWNKKRISPQEKIEDFINQSESIIYEIRNQARVADNKWLRLVASFYNFWWRGAYMFSLLLNATNLLCMRMGHFGTRSGCSMYMELLRLSIGVLQLLFWSLSTAEYFIIKLPLTVNDRKLKKKEEGNDTTDSNTKHPDQTAGGITLQDLKEGFWKDPAALYHAGMVVLSILGFKYPALYAIHLLDFLFRDEVLHGVISSITLNWNSLSKTALLGVIIVYIYSVVSYVFFRQSFDSRKGHYCNSLPGCFLTILSYGVRSGGGVGDLLNVPTNDLYYPRILLDLSFFLVVVVFLLNVIFGQVMTIVFMSSIIFDNFGQLREERLAIYEDLRSVCYICSIKATEFQQSKGFEHHTHHEHNIWHYLFFLVHLKTKDITEYTSHEQYVAEKLAENDLSFFPIHRALTLKKRDQANEVEERLKRIEDALQKWSAQQHLAQQALLESDHYDTPSTPSTPAPLPMPRHASTAARRQSLFNY